MAHAVQRITRGNAASRRRASLRSVRRPRYCDKDRRGNNTEAAGRDEPNRTALSSSGTCPSHRPLASPESLDHEPGVASPGSPCAIMLCHAAVAATVPSPRITRSDAEHSRQPRRGRHDRGALLLRPGDRTSGKTNRHACRPQNPLRYRLSSVRMLHFRQSATGQENGKFIKN